VKKLFTLIALSVVVVAGATNAAVSGTVSERLREAIAAFVREQSPRPLEVVRIPALRDFDVPGFDPAAVKISLSVSPHENFSGSVPVTATLEVAGVAVKRGVITVRVESLARALVAVRPLKRGAEIRDEDLVVQNRVIASLPRGYLTQRSQAVGLQAVRAVPMGAFIVDTMLVEKPIIKRGEIVALRFESNGLRIDGRGRASEDGKVGDRIRVVGEWARRELSGQVSSDGVVHVGF
jgi:flagella basal body P-ring formation protein FlgA